MPCVFVHALGLWVCWAGNLGMENGHPSPFARLDPGHQATLVLICHLPLGRSSAKPVARVAELDLLNRVKPPERTRELK